MEEEQHSNARAECWKQILKKLSAKPSEHFDDGWSVETLDKCRKFYRVYSSNQISSTMQTNLEFVNSVDEIENDKQRLSSQPEKGKQCLPYSGSANNGVANTEVGSPNTTMPIWCSSTVC